MQTRGADSPNSSQVCWVSFIRHSQPENAGLGWDVRFLTYRYFYEVIYYGRDSTRNIDKVLSTNIEKSQGLSCWDSVMRGNNPLMIMLTGVVILECWSVCLAVTCWRKAKTSSTGCGQSKLDSVLTQPHGQFNLKTSLSDPDQTIYVSSWLTDFW